MLHPGVRAAAQSLLPGFVLRALDPFESSMTAAVRQFAASLPAGARVLDAGAGESRYADMFTAQRYVAIDMAVGDIAWNYSRLDLLGDLTALPLADGTFDAAINVVTLEHVQSPQEAITEMARVLRPGGRLLLVVPLEWEVHQAPHDYFRYTRYGVGLLLQRAGLEATRLEPVGGFFWLMARRSVNFLTFFQGGPKWLLFALFAPFFGLLIPLVLYAADGLDRQRDFTLGYICEAVKR